MNRDVKNISEWEVLTPGGWSDFKAVKKLTRDSYYCLELDSGATLKASANHRVKLHSGKFEYIEKLEKGTVLLTGEVVRSIQEVREVIDLYDLLGVVLDSEYFTNGIVSHNCAFIDNIEETYAAAQQTLATGGQCMALSTPNGVGNWFHKTWEKAEARENSFIPIKLPWTVHPERDQSWRTQQDADLGIRLAAQECDTSFLSSGETVIEPEDLQFYEETYQQDPSDRRGVDGNLWVWEYPDYSKDYMVVADVARGDGADYSAFHVIDIQAATQVAEFKSKVAPKDFGNILVGIASEYNDALLVVENANIGWSTIEKILERDYKNFYYSSRSDQETVESYMSKYERDKLVPGFTMSLRTRPLVIAKMMEYIREKSCTIRSKRLLSELRVFVWKNGKAQAQPGYNDDLVMSFATGLYVRDTALRLRQQGMDLTRAQMQTFLNTNQRQPVIQNVGYLKKNPYTMDTPYGAEDVSWILH